MAWSITGSHAGTVLGLSDSGVPICHGKGEHECMPPGLNDFGTTIDRTLLARIQKAKCVWTFALPNDAPIHIDANGEGLLQRIQQAPGKSHGMIKFYANPDCVGVTAVLPEAAFFHARRLLELILASESLRYSISLDFLGFRSPKATTSTPTWEEFIDGKPYFFNEITLAVGRQ